MDKITIQTAIKRQLACLQADFDHLLDHCIAMRTSAPQLDDMLRRLAKLQRLAKQLH